MAINNLPDGPSTNRYSGQNLILKAFALFNALNPFVNETNAVVVAFNFNSTKFNQQFNFNKHWSCNAYSPSKQKSYVIGMTVKIALMTSNALTDARDVTAYNSGTAL